MNRFGSLLISILLVLSLALSGCGATGNPPAPNGAEDTETNPAVRDDFQAQMTFNGSSTLAPVISAIATDFIEEYTSWDKVKPDFPDENIAIYVSAGGSSAGVKAVLDGTSDFGMLAREIKDEELDKIDNPTVLKLGIDALTVSIHPENPLNQIKDDLSTEEIKAIFSGEYMYWDDLDSNLPHKEIVVVIRDLGGGAHEVFQKAVMGDTFVRDDAIQAPSMGALVAKIIENKDAIGYASYGMVNQNIGKLNPLKVDGVEPIEENIVNGSYKISRPLIVVKEQELNSAQKAFMDIVQSEAGAKIIEQMGFVPIR